MLRITPSGRAEPLRRLSEPKESEITDGGALFTLPAFLSQVPGPSGGLRYCANSVERDADHAPTA
ncbi:hypothetical protein [Streptomyces sp. SID2999]|uniref:hypothetical protein n=1 Tax=Streptomyces sp. SID2999 TaxID=2690258 RepID=UPI001F3FEFA9|nr:hypothetical protein [Streptomyces sp. SID2999]